MINPRASIDILLGQQPAWFTSAVRVGKTVEGRAFVEHTPWATSGVPLRISNFPIPKVGEHPLGTCFPARCPERHIQYDETFCLGLRYLTVDDAEKAIQWWEQLRQFLRLQGVAELTGIWPPEHALDHGDAGEFHEQALAIAGELSIDEEYKAARLNEPSWITDPDLRLLGRKGEPINGRAPCPRGCRDRCMVKGNRSRPMLRRSCDHRAKLLDLVRLERKRRTALAEYWSHVRAEGLQCCGRMRSCELREPTYKSEGKFTFAKRGAGQ
ncbi:hypothetical protein ACVWZA_001888 [Sphingomonas sp. UYAg733]